MSWIKRPRGGSAASRLAYPLVAAGFLFLSTSLASVASPRAAQSTGAPHTTPDAANAPSSIFFPLAAGDTWTYRRVVAEGQKVLFWDAYPSNGSTFTEWGPHPDIAPGVTEETYQVTGRVDSPTWDLLFPDGAPTTHTVIPFWYVSVTPDTARDGRYKGLMTHPDQILWGRAASSPYLIQIDELLVHNCSACAPIDETKVFTRIPFVEVLVPGNSVKITRYVAVTLEVPIQRFQITVPAGTFDDCVRATETVTTDDVSWTLDSYYAPGVGLVSETQVDASGVTRYVLELSTYNVH
jgi:hypothetical protein